MQFVKANRYRYTVSVMCSALDVSRSGYYAWLNRKPSARKQADQACLKEIQVVRKRTKSKLGQKKTWQVMLLLMEVCPWGRHQVARLMQANGLKAKKKRPFRPTTTDSRHALSVAPNRLEQNFESDAPNKKWVSDITYLWTQQGWLYLCVIVDLYSRRVVGWALQETMTQDLVLSALRKAVAARRPATGLIFHSDRGSQYASSAVRDVLSLNGMLQSMSRPGNCYDNAVSESWFAAFKTEAIPDEGFYTKTEASLAVFEQIEGFYNTIRPHETLGGISPNMFESCAMTHA
jgi:putative transposase